MVVAGILWLVALLLLLLFSPARFKLIGGLLFILRFGLFSTAVGGVVGLLSLCSELPFGLPLGCLLLIKVGVPSRLRFNGSRERLQIVSRQDALHLDESLDAGDVSRAWLVWSGAAEAALDDACRFSGGPLPSGGLVLGRGSALFRVVRLGGHQVRKARGNVADALDAADVFLYRDSSVAPLLDMRRRLKAVMDVLGAMIHSGISLSRSVELTAQWDRILALGSPYLVTLGDLSVDRVWALVHFIMLLLMFIVVLATSFMQLWFTVVMRRLGGGGIGFGKTPWCIPIDGSGLTWFPQLGFSSVSPISRLVVLECLLILPGLMRNSERLGFPICVAVGKGIPALRNSIVKLRGGYHFYLRFICPG